MSYYGGVTQVIKRRMGTGYYYDINSHYPNSMIGMMPAKCLGIRVGTKDNPLIIFEKLGREATTKFRELEELSPYNLYLVDL
jgi:hypothetical protein